MKKPAALLLALLMCLTLSACGQSEEAKAAADAIDAIGEVTYESGDAIREAEALYEALSEDDRKTVRNIGKLIDSREEYGALVDEAVNELLVYVTALNEAVAVMDVAACYEAIDAIHAAFDGMNPALYEVAVESTASEDGTTLLDAVSQYETTLAECCVNDTKIAQPAYVVTYAAQGAWLVNDHGEFAAYNWWAENEDDTASALAEYKAYVAENTAVTETDDGFTFLDNSGDTVTVLISTNGILQVRVPRF